MEGRLQLDKDKVVVCPTGSETIHSYI